ncbi:MAG: RagB/SusD family nutrient uptake outer membrane protein [Cytophagales bacterium]|nr:RagB/SusD family nutrient uptake outer membrane protein [Cytophagales bacterium]
MMLKIKSSYAAGLMTLLLIFAIACDTEEVLNPTQPTTLSDQQAFSSPSRVLLQVNGLYASLKSGQLLGGRMQVYNEVRGEDFTNRLGNGVTALFAWNYSQLSTNAEPFNAWTNAYLTINRCNVFLKGLDDNAGVVDEALANQYRGEARFIRAVTYYFLVNLYARPYAVDNGNTPGLPLRVEAETGPANRDLARSTVAEVYNQITLDLDFAEQNLPLTYATPLLNVTRAHRNSAIAFKTRVYLAMQRYDKVVEEARKIVAQTTGPFKATSGVLHELAPNVATVFAAPYTSTESIFSLPMTTNDVPGVQNGLGHYFNRPGSGFGNGEYYLDPGAQGILNNPAFTAADARRTALLVTVTSGTSSLTYVRKFPLNPFTDYPPITRYAEVLLNYAEAQARLSGTVDPLALNLLNAVRGRSAPDAVYTEASFATGNDLVNAILLERRIELMGEGFRGIDITRLGLPLPAKTGVQGSVPVTSQQYIWPIPQVELDNNRLMEQNN